MVYLALVIPLCVIIILRKTFCETYVSPTSMFCFIWIVIVSLMAFLAPTFYFTYEAVFYILNFSLFFLIGEFLFFGLNNGRFLKNNKKVFYDENFRYRLKNYTLVISVISLIGSVFYFKSFLNYYGSFAEFLIAGSLIRGDLFGGNIEISALSIFAMLLSYSAINLALVYYSKFGFSWFQIIPFFSVFISAFSQAARAGLVIVIFQIFAGKIFRLISQNKVNVEYRLLKPLLYAIPFLLFIFTIVEMFRHQNFEVNIDGLSDTDSALSIYTFGGTAGFSSYLSDLHLFSNELTYGRYTFSSLYNILGIAKAEPGIYDQYLNVSPTQTANVYSIFRPLLEDFGYFGMTTWALILGFIANIVYYKSINGSLVAVSLAISLYIYLMFSFIAPLTQFNSFLLSCVLGPVIIQLSTVHFTFKHKTP